MQCKCIVFTINISSEPNKFGIKGLSKMGTLNSSQTAFTLVTD